MRAFPGEVHGSPSALVERDEEVRARVTEGHGQACCDHLFLRRLALYPVVVTAAHRLEGCRAVAG